MPALPAPFIVVGMIACFGSIAHAPLGLMLMVAEMTGSLALLPPAMVAIGLATLVVGDDTIYESQLRSRADAPAHRAAVGLPLLSAVTVADVMTRPLLLLLAETPERGAHRLLNEANLNGAAVVTADGNYVGVVSSDAKEHQSDTTTGAAADRDYPTVQPDRGLDVALDVMVSAGTSWVPVVDANTVVGIVAMDEIIAGYQRALRRSLRLLAGTSGGNSVLVEATVADTSPFAGTTVATAPWPPGSFVLSIDRHSQLIAPRPETEIQPGDVVAAVIRVDGEANLRRRLSGETR